MSWSRIERKLAGPESPVPGPRRLFLNWKTYWVENGRLDSEEEEEEVEDCSEETASAGRSRRRRCPGTSAASALLTKTLRRATAELKRHCDPLMVEPFSRAPTTLWKGPGNENTAPEERPRTF